MTEIINTIREKRRTAIADMPEPIITLGLKQVNDLLEHVETIEREKNTLVDDLVTVNRNLGLTNKT